MKFELENLGIESGLQCMNGIYEYPNSCKSLPGGRVAVFW